MYIDLYLQAPSHDALVAALAAAGIEHAPVEALRAGEATASEGEWLLDDRNCQGVVPDSEAFCANLRLWGAEAETRRATLIAQGVVLDPGPETPKAEWAGGLPYDPPPARENMILSVAFMDRFTQAEQLAIQAAGSQVPALGLWLTRLAAAHWVELDAPVTRAGLDAAVAAGLLAPERVAAVLA